MLSFWAAHNSGQIVIHELSEFEFRGDSSSQKHIRSELQLSIGSLKSTASVIPILRPTALQIPSVHPAFTQSGQQKSMRRQADVKRGI